jgi:protein disulfide isomerase
MMKYIFALTLIILLQSAYSAKPVEDGILTLKEATFDKYINENQLVLVEFFDPTCHHCKKFASEYANIAKNLTAEKSPVKVVKVDVKDDRSLADKYEAPHWPSIYLFMAGNPVRFKGVNGEQEIKNWIEKKLKSSTWRIDSLEHLENVTQGLDAYAFFWGDSDHEHFALYDAASKAVDDLVHFVTNSTEVKEKLGGAAATTISIVRKFANDVLHYDGDWSFTNIAQFLHKNRLPEIQTYSPRTMERIFAQTKPALFLIYEKGDAGDKAIEEFTKAAKVLIHKNLELVIGDYAEPITQQLANFAHIGGANLPAVRILQPIMGNFPQKYKLKDEITAENIIEFWREFNANELEEYRRSEDVPTDDTAPVKTIVADNFDDIVLDGTKDVLLYFYGPGCEACDQFAPIYEDLAKRVESVKYLIISKINAAANDIPEFPVVNYPAIKFFGARNKGNPTDYTGDKTAEAIIPWLKKKATWAKWPKNADEL